MGLRLSVNSNPVFPFFSLTGADFTGETVKMRECGWISKKILRKWGVITVKINIFAVI